LNQRAVTLIFDIGKTTKKVLLFDNNFNTLEEQTKSFPEIQDDDGFPAENLEALSVWCTQVIQHFLNHPEFQVTHINFSAYGASLVYLSKDGNVIQPFYNYLKPFPQDCKNEFLRSYNADNDLSTTTASPFLGLLNSGLQLYWLKKKKRDLFSSIATSLHLPQYFTYLLTRKKFSDLTSIGCHTMLWNFEKQDYHEWVDKEGVRKFFPPVHAADYTTNFLHNGINVKVGIGVHDSSAALMPYLVVMKEKFLLLSTGTWNICFNPFNDQLLSPTELSQDCLCFLTFDGKPVKASRIFLGHEHELQQQAMAAYFKVDHEFYKTIAFNADIYNRLTADKAFVNFSPLGMEGTGPILNASASPTDYSRLNSFEEAQHHLIRQLVHWQKVSVDLTDPGYTIKDLIVVGGFTKSKLFLEIMKRELPERRILISDHPRAAALGAAWLVCGKEGYTGKSDLLKVIPV
jgi:sugar (pentulose or hexulose) kinase